MWSTRNKGDDAYTLWPVPGWVVAGLIANGWQCNMQYGKCQPKWQHEWYPYFTVALNMSVKCMKARTFFMLVFQVLYIFICWLFHLFIFIFMVAETITIIHILYWRPVKDMHKIIKRTYNFNEICQEVLCTWIQRYQQNHSSQDRLISFEFSWDFWSSIDWEFIN